VKKKREDVSWDWSEHLFQKYSEALELERHTPCICKELEKPGPKEGCSRWQEAQARASLAAERYAVNIVRVVHSEGRAKAPLTKLAPPQAPNSHSSADRFLQPPPGAGGPCDDELHDDVLKFVDVASGRKAPLSRCRFRSPAAKTRAIRSDSEEYKAVIAYFQRTLQKPSVTVRELRRLEDPAVAYSPRSAETIMFHGCRSFANEASILKNGFQVSKCYSGGSNFGTWFAYNASYSDSGFAIIEPSGLRHLFICVVNYDYTVLDNTTMRVVGQNCAFPLWLVSYQYPATVARPASRLQNAAKAPIPKTFYVVRDGKWVQERVNRS